MPATITHAFFAKDLYDILPENIVEKIDFDRVKMFSQSTDPLMFYNLCSVLPGKNIRKFQKYFHDNKSQDFFINLLTYIRSINLEDKDTYSFLTGFISHYVLDSIIHPYVVYKTGIFDKKRPSTYKYNNIHHFMESFIDMDMVRRRLRVNPYTYDFTKYCFDGKAFSKDLNKAINYTFYTTFNIKDMSKIYYKSLKQTKCYLKAFRMDKHGTKKVMYKVLDTITPRRCFRFEAISYHQPLEDKHNFLNNKHLEWRSPINYDMTSTESFVDLYLKALKEAKRIVQLSFDFLDGKNIKLEEVFDNTSYITGVECGRYKDLKYFEF